MTRHFFQMAVCLSLGFWVCVIWTIIESTVEQNELNVRWFLAIGSIVLHVVCFLFLFMWYIFSVYAIDHREVSLNAPHPDTRCDVTSVEGTPYIPPFLLVELEVEDLTIEQNIVRTAERSHEHVGCAPECHSAVKLDVDDVTFESNLVRV
jgi:hypothetical protein